ncbi:GHMP family kinase ATP-binding protein [Spiroplasma taiwanense]|uniref:GHMP family kinase ATP-binding protein n=1 Tax=Spiroplasma taiwanense TaxID=2145 RepID=UPI0022A9C64A|nr:hypothetical protein [Spiroplasma taiwanense]
MYKLKGKYHKIKSLFTIVENLYDEIVINKNKLKMDKIKCNIKKLETENFIYKVLEILRKHKVIKNFYSITLKKNIPLGSGLGGGSSNAISVAKAFTNNKKILKKIAKKIGMDCYFFIKEFNTAYVKGYGNRVYKRRTRVIIKKENLIFTNIEVDTKLVYSQFDKIESWKNRKEQNMLTIPALSLYPELVKFANLGFMSGSGSTFIKNNKNKP